MSHAAIAPRLAFVQANFHITSASLWFDDRTNRDLFIPLPQSRVTLVYRNEPGKARIWDHYPVGGTSPEATPLRSNARVDILHVKENIEETNELCERPITFHPPLVQSNWNIPIANLTCESLHCTIVFLLHWKNFTQLACTQSFPLRNVVPRRNIYIMQLDRDTQITTANIIVV